MIVVAGNNKVKQIKDELIKIVNNFNEETAEQCVAIFRLKQEVSIDINATKVHAKQQVPLSKKLGAQIEDMQQESKRGAREHRKER